MREYRNSNIDCGIWQSLARAKNSELQCLSVCDLSLVNIFPPKGAAILKYFMTCREAEFFRRKTAAQLAVIFVVSFAEWNLIKMSY